MKSSRWVEIRDSRFASRMFVWLRKRDQAAYFEAVLTELHDEQVHFFVLAPVATEVPRTVFADGSKRWIAMLRCIRKIERLDLGTALWLDAKTC